MFTSNDLRRGGVFAFAMLVSLVAGAAVQADAPSGAPTPTTDRVQQVEWSFRDLGAYAPIKLRGVDGQGGLSFGVRLDQVVTRAHLQLRYTYSPALLPQLSHLKVLLNNEVVATLPLLTEQAGREVTQEIDIDPRYFSDFNHLELHLIGHYTMECEDSQHSSLWANISHRSNLQLSLRELKLQDELGLLPVPFFDRRDGRRLQLPFVLAGAADDDALQAASVLASWFGAQAGYRGARFPVSMSRLPLAHTVVLARNGERVEGLELAAVEQPTLSVLPHPLDPAMKLLLVQGKDSLQLRTAAAALTLGRVALGGNRATVASLAMDPRRPAYDAPNWVRTDRPVTLGELVGSPAELQAVGHAPNPLRVNLRVPPDLLTWNRLGVPIDLRYRYTPPVEQDNSLLTISINEQFVQSFRLRPSGKTSTEGRLLVPLLGDGQAQLQDEVVIPAFQVGSNNQLQFQFVTDLHKQGLCKDTANDLVRAAIDPDSTLDLTRFPHYAAMPNLALFANAGFPFSKYADLAETLVVMPDVAEPAHIEALLFLMGRVGRVTGVPALRVRVGRADAALKLEEPVDLLVIGGPAGKDLLAQWSRSLSAVIERTRRSVTAGENSPNFVRDLLDSKRDISTQWRVEFETGGALGVLLGFESPLHSGRSVVAVSGSNAAAAAGVLDALEDEGRIGQIRGDTVFVREAALESYQVAEPYHVGHLPLWLAIRYHLSGHPLLLALAGVFAGLLLALLVYWQLRRVAARRLEP